MNLDRVINMVVRTLVRRGTNAGINQGAKLFSKGGGSRNMAKSVQQLMRQARRMTKR